MSELCPGRNSEYKNKQRAITRKLDKAVLRFLCTAHLPNRVCLLTKLHVDTSCCYRVMSRTRKADGRTTRRTERRTDKAATICSFFGEHKKCKLKWKLNSWLMLPRYLYTTKEVSSALKSCTVLHFSVV
jgi:hypothetical protein